MKLNIDTSVRIGKKEAGIRAIIRDSEGMVVTSFARRIIGFFLPHIAECLTLQERLSFAQDLSLQIEITEMDVVCLAYEVQNPSLINENSVLIADIIGLSRYGIFNYCFYVPRGAK